MWQLACNRPVTKLDVLMQLGEAPLQKIFSEDNKFVNFGLSTKEILQHLASKNFNVLFVSLMFSHEWPSNKRYY